MDNIASERFGIPLAEQLCTSGFNSGAGLLLHSAPEDIVLTPGIDADHCHIR
jgi:hypothetical protein